MNTDKCSIEDDGDILVDVICSWWSGIHRGNDAYMDCLHGAIMCSQVKYYHDLKFLFDIAIILVEEHNSSDTPALLRNQAS